MLVDFLGVLILLTAFEMLVQSYVKQMINTVAIQSILLALMLAILGFERGSIELYILSVLTLIVRGLAIPELMRVDVKKRKIWEIREVETRVPALIIFGILLAIVGFAFYATNLYPIFGVKGGAMPIILLLLGFLMIIARRNALAQMIGYIVEENALLYAGVTLTHLPMILEAGVFLDLLGLVLIGVLLSAEKEYGVLELEELVG